MPISFNESFRYKLLIKAYFDSVLLNKHFIIEDKPFLGQMIFYIIMRKKIKK